MKRLTHDVKDTPATYADPFDDIEDTKWRRPGQRLCDFQTTASDRPDRQSTAVSVVLSHLVGIQTLNVLSFKPGVGQYTAIHATLTAKDFFFAYFYPSGPFSCIFSKTSPDLFFLCWLWLTLVPV